MRTTVIGLAFGHHAPPLARQLGVAGTNFTCGVWQRDADAIQRLVEHGLLTTAEAARAEHRLARRIFDAAEQAS